MDGTIPRAKLPMVLRRMQELSAQYGLRVANVFHAGDGNLHPLILYDANKPGELERAEAFGADILRLCVEVGGVLTGEHGVGVEKRDLMPVMFSEVDLNQQQRLKCAFDDEGLLNPGKVFPTLHRCAELGRMHVHRRPAGVPRHAAVLTHRSMTEHLTPRDAASWSRPSIGRSPAARRWRWSDAAASARSAGRRSGTPPSIFPAFSGVTLYEPAELVLSAAAGTPIAEIEALVAASGQELAFEPMDYGPLLGITPDGGTIGGALAANLSGPRRIKAGAARDHFLGVSAVSGRGETFKSGGRVVKNVTGYDLCKLLAGSWGTLAAMTDVTLKTLPRAETEETILLLDLDDATGGQAHDGGHRLRRRCLGGRASAGSASPRASPPSRPRAVPSPRSASKASLLRSRTARRFWRSSRRLSAGLALGRGAFARAVAGDPRRGAVRCGRARRRALRLAHFDGAVARRRNRPRARRAGRRPRSSTTGPAASSGRHCRPRTMPARRSCDPTVAAAGGHATLIRAPAAVRAAIDVFEPEPAALAALTKRVRESFDPRGVLNAGRMWAGV